MALNTTFRKQPPVLANTPITTEGRREHLLLSASVLPEIPVGEFFSRHMPIKNVTPRKLATITNKLKRDQSWILFTSTLPKDRSEHEGVVYGAILQSYTLVAAELGTPTYPGAAKTWLDTGNTAPTGSHKGVRTRPDGTIYLTELSITDLISAINAGVVRVSWLKVGFLAEYKKKLTEQTFYDDSGKMVFNMEHLMSSDARRRFIMGITIENTRARLWHTDRSGKVVSEPFDILEHPEHLVHVFAALHLASEEQLGFDSTIRLVDDDTNYEIDVKDMETGEIRTFITSRYVSDAGVNRLMSRGTRAWAVYEKGCSPDNLMLLKDSWAYDGSHEFYEGQNYDRLLKRATENGLTEEYESSFFRCTTHGTVNLSNNLPDNTFETIRGGVKPPAPTVELGITEDAAEMGSLAWTQLEHDDQFILCGGSEQPAFLAKTHYRLVLDGVGETIEECDEMGACLGAILHGMRGLDLLDKLGFIHGDVSNTNVVAVSPNGGRLIDLEFMREPRRIQAGAPAATTLVLSGTRWFMAHEVIAGTWRYVTLRFENKFENSFSMQPSHDVESMWWTLLWIVAAKRPIGWMPSATDPALHITLYEKFFPPRRLSNDIPSNTIREKVLTKTNHKDLQALFTSLPPQFHSIEVALRAFQGKLICRFEKEQNWEDAINYDDVTMLAEEIVPILQGAVHDCSVVYLIPL